MIEVGESCDDGNKINGDGCSTSCLIEDRFDCSGNFGDISKCKQNMAVCGNRIF